MRAKTERLRLFDGKESDLVLKLFFVYSNLPKVRIIIRGRKRSVRFDFRRLRMAPAELSAPCRCVVW
jgi:hypothetical protein